MESRIQKISKKNQQSPCTDLPEDILGFIVGKLKYAADVIRFRVVCKSWHLPKDMIIKYKHHRNLPWLCNFSWAENNPNYLECEIYEPYCRLKFETWILVENENCLIPKRDNYNNKVFAYGSKQGWLIAGYFEDGMYSMFLYNPYSKRYIPLLCAVTKPYFATFFGNPASPDFRLFLLISKEGSLGTYIYKLDEVMVLEMVTWFSQHECHGVQYVNEQLFCFLEDGTSLRFNLQDDSRALYDKLATDHNELLWLAKGEGDILVAVKGDLDGKCSTFYFDWSSMCWVEKDLPESSAIFISGDIATFVTPFVGYGDREKKKNCNVYFFSELVCEKELSDNNVLQI